MNDHHGDTNNFSASKKFPAFYGTVSSSTVFKKPCQVYLLLSHINLVHILPFSFFKIHFNITLSSSPIYCGGISVRHLHQFVTCWSFYGQEFFFCPSTTAKLKEHSYSVVQYFLNILVDDLHFWSPSSYVHCIP